MKSMKALAFLDTAAIIKNLDLVITCDTSIAHLSGALGCLTYIMLGEKHDWRWFLNNNDSIGILSKII